MGLLTPKNADWESGYVQGVKEEQELLGLDLHDSVLQDLAYLRLRVDQLDTVIVKSPQSAAGLLREIRAELQSTSAMARELAVALTDGQAPGSLADAVTQAVERFRNRFEGAVSFEVLGKPRTVIPLVNAHLLRITQEMLSNVWKHASATHVTIVLQFLPDRIVLMVRDDGRGFRSDSDSGRGLGFRGMRGRARAIGARLTVSTNLGRGTGVILVLKDRAKASLAGPDGSSS